MNYKYIKIIQQFNDMTKIIYIKLNKKNTLLSQYKYIEIKGTTIVNVIINKNENFFIQQDGYILNTHNKNVIEEISEDEFNTMKNISTLI